MPRTRSRVFNTKEFVNWFERQIIEQMGCRDVGVSIVIVHTNGVSVMFKCNNKTYVAEIKNSRRFKASVYVLDYENDLLIRIKKIMLKDPLKVYDKRLEIVSDNALFYVVDGVNIDVYEYQPPSGTILKPRGGTS